MSHAAAAAELKAHPGEWARVAQYGSAQSAWHMAWIIRNGRSTAYSPPGDFEAESRTLDDGEHWIYIRYVGPTEE